MELKVGGFYLTRAEKLIGPLVKDEYGRFTTMDLDGKVYWNTRGQCVEFTSKLSIDIRSWSMAYELFIKEAEPKMAKKTYIVKGSQSKSFDHLSDAETWAREQSQKNPSYRWTIYAEEAICYYECPPPQPVRTAL